MFGTFVKNVRKLTFQIVFCQESQIGFASVCRSELDEFQHDSEDAVPLSGANMTSLGSILEFFVQEFGYCSLAADHLDQMLANSLETKAAACIDC